MINISKIAQQHFHQLLLKKTKNTHIRIFVTNPGTSIADCGVSYCTQHEIETDDLEIKYDKFNVYIDVKSVLYLKDAKIDLVRDGINSCLTLTAPFAKGKNNNKYIDLMDRIQLFLDHEVNPNLSLHGGKVSLIEITDLRYLIVKFSGGCNGCAMISTTLKENIEKKILLLFPEIKGITDSTEHNHGNHSYY
ncbi:MAG TPA: NfuA family Fe-S biogenesis protein [Buchnera sp. (in: enterobacteria)]|nr:NfuA family Fe-S biogenesis protein [Buchnera sp. (in: enterobacteria)]